MAPGPPIEIAKAISFGTIYSQESKNYLFVSHGIFSAGFEELSDYFEKIYTTNSYKDITNDLVIIEDIF